jgi:hypothetical protein
VDENYCDPTSSSDKTCAFLARSRARAQSPARPASRASEIKLRTLEARSDCVAFNGFPAVAARLRSAVVKLCSVSRCNAVDSCVDNSGTICGASGFSVRAFGFAGGATLCGLAGAGGVRVASGAAGSGTSSSRSGTGTSSTPFGEGCCDAIGRTSTAVLQGMVGLFCAAHPPAKITAELRTPKKIRTRFRITASWGWAEVSVIFNGDRTELRIRPREATRFGTSSLCRLPS